MKFKTPHLKDTYDTWLEPKSMRLLANFYWRTILGVGCIVVVFAFAYGVWDLYSVLNNLGNETPPLPATAKPVLNQTLLQATLDVFSVRQAKFEALQSTTTKILVPSR